MLRILSRRALSLFGIGFISGILLPACALFPDTAPGTGPVTKKDRISIVVNSQGITFPEGLDENHNPYLDYIVKHTGIDVNVTIPPSEGYEEQLDIYMASGKVPDMMTAFSDVWVADYAQQEALLPLDDLIDRYGPDLKAKIPQEAWDSVRFNGRIYAVPSLNDSKGMELMYARKDWLDKLGLAPPETLDEYAEVIRAFAERDPDGNGKNDTYGLVLAEHLGRSAPFFGAYGVQLNQWTERDGKLVYTNILPETKEALAYLHKLYANKWIDAEFPLNKDNNLADKVASGKVGLYSATWFDTHGPIAANMIRDEKAIWIPLSYPTGPRGQKGVYESPLVHQYQVIPSGSTNAAAVIRFLNFLAGSGHRDLELGFENQVWTRINGDIVTDFVENNKHQYRGIYASLVYLDDPEFSKVRLDSMGEQFHLYENQRFIEKNLIVNEFSGLPTPAMSKYSDRLQELDEVFVKMIVGTVPLEDFDNYIRQWKSEGGDVVTAEVNEWYNTVNP